MKFFLNLNFFLMLILMLNSFYMILKSLNIFFIYLILLSICMISYSVNKNNNLLLINLSIFFSTTIISMLMNYTINSNWYSIILFLIMISGLMILFLYFNSLIIYKSKINMFFIKNFFLKILMTLMTLNMLILSENYLMMINFPLLMLKPQLNLINFSSPNEKIIFFLLKNYFFNWYFLIFYLLLSLFTITYLIKFNNKSLRSNH